jgi:hypothetical protein
MAFPETGKYTFPDGLATLHIDPGEQLRDLLGAQCVEDPP